MFIAERIERDDSTTNEKTFQNPISYWLVTAQRGAATHRNYFGMNEFRFRRKKIISLLVSNSVTGAFLFSFWETDWDYLEGSYFCFVTLSTIGFGDLVPGQSIEGSEQKLAICSIYLLTGRWYYLESLDQRKLSKSFRRP